jgi:hypothetical protein
MNNRGGSFNYLFYLAIFTLMGIALLFFKIIAMTF